VFGQVIVKETWGSRGNHDEGKPLDSMEGIGFRRAFAFWGRGAPWMTRGSFMRVTSSFAGTEARLAEINSILV